MVKRIAARKATWVALLGILVLTGLLVAISPPDQAPTFEGQVRIPGDGGEWVIFWGTSTSANTSPMGPAPGYTPKQLPNGILVQLPQDVQDFITSQNGNTQASIGGGGFPYTCEGWVSDPYLHGSEVRGRVDLSCIGDGYTHTRVEGELKKGSTTLDDYDSGWRTWSSHGQTLKDTCPSGTNNFENIGDFSVKEDDGDIETGSADRDLSLTC